MGKRGIIECLRNTRLGRQVSMEPIRMFFYKWPRNIAISFAVETFIAQPIARLIMLKMHQVKDEKGEIGYKKIA